MPEWASTLIIVAVVLLVFFGMWAGWRARARRDGGLTPSHDVPAALGAPLVRTPALYVATTGHNAPLERLAVTGLGFRAQGSLSVHPEGAVLQLAGEEPVWIAASQLQGAHAASVVIDKAVEKDGLVVLTWTLNGTLVDSYFRLGEPALTGPLYAAINALTPTESEV